ncbi:hypothetical protein SKAU_G00320570 [Synaphobranchus kaupii]|uniref:Uncharacterized protein n=1 Tax=Synaphobranchus kaupii TaxID=118154 RepID=A0A9Q1ENQ1_SYNKA|nr:hypothetical protein SKAU_G00320570 [Synaphobranchus kaupii]
MTLSFIECHALRASFCTSTCNTLICKLLYRKTVTMTTKLVIEQPKPVTDRVESNQWSSGIFDCWEDKANCCFVCWCCPCFACQKSREYGQCLCLPLLDMCGIVPPITLAMRVSMRDHYGIRGTICNDCVYATCCRLCVWCQMAKEMKTRFQPIVLINAKARE